MLIKNEKYNITMIIYHNRLFSMEYPNIFLDTVFKNTLCDTLLGKITDEWYLIHYYYDNYFPFAIGKEKNNYRVLTRDDFESEKIFNLFMITCSFNKLSTNKDGFYFTVRINDYFGSLKYYDSINHCVKNIGPILNNNGIYILGTGMKIPGDAQQLLFIE